MNTVCTDLVTDPLITRINRHDQRIELVRLRLYDERSLRGFRIYGRKMDYTRHVIEYQANSLTMHVRRRFAEGGQMRREK